MTFDELKRTWENIDSRSTLPPSSAEDIEQRVALHLVASTRDKLSSQFYRLAIICALSPLLFIPLWNFSHLMVLICIGYMLLMGVLQLILGLKTDRIDIARSTVADALQRTVKLESLRGTFRWIGMTLGLPVIAFMGWVLFKQSDPALFYGFLAGVVIGGVIGLIKNARLARQIRLMKLELTDIE